MNIRKFVFATLLTGAAVAANAQVERTGDDNARAMQQLQQLSAERVQLKSENERLKAELDDAKKKLTDLTTGQSALQGKLKAAESAASRDAASNQQNAESLEKLRGQTQELIGRFRETAQTLKEVETDRNTARADLKNREHELDVCIQRNVGLYDMNTEILDRYEHKGVWSSLTEKEPFTRIQRARLENLIDDYKEHAAELRVENKTASSKQ